jgi:hypothetical protein
MAKHGGRPDSYDAKSLRSKARDIYVPDLHIEQLKMKARNFQYIVANHDERKNAAPQGRPLVVTKAIKTDMMASTRERPIWSSNSGH